MLKLLLLLAFGCCVNAEPAPVTREDPMLAALMAGGAVRAAVCLERRGCAGALWARHWLLTRASCVSYGGQSSLRGATVLLYHEPGECDRIREDDTRFLLKAMSLFVYPAYVEPEFPTPEFDPLDAALVLLAGPGPLGRPFASTTNHSVADALTVAPELRTWLRYVPAMAPWTLDRVPEPAPTADPADYRLLDSPLRMIVATVLLPAAALLLAFLLLLRWPESCAAGDYSEEKLLVPVDESV